MSPLQITTVRSFTDASRLPSLQSSIVNAVNDSYCLAAAFMSWISCFFILL